MTILRMLQLFTNQIKEFVNTNFSFSNKSTLENIKDTDVYAWGKAAKHIGDENVHLSTNEKQILNNVVNAGYALSTDVNKALDEKLDTSHVVSNLPTGGGGVLMQQVLLN